MKEADYRRVTYDITLAAARMLARLNPDMTFIYVSGTGTDSSETRPQHVGPREGQDGERFAAAAVQGRLHVPSRSHRPAARGQIQDQALSGCSTLRWVRCCR